METVAQVLGIIGGIFAIGIFVLALLYWFLHYITDGFTKL